MKIIVWTNIIIFSVVVIAIILSLIYKNKSYLDDGRVGVFLNIISGLTFVLLFPGTILAAIAVHRNEERLKMEKTIKAQEIEFLRPINYMKENWNDCPKFIKSLWPQVKDIQDYKIDENKFDDPFAIIQVTSNLLQSIENHLIHKEFELTKEREWGGTFLQWTSSDLFVKKAYEIFNNYSLRTKKYFDILVEYANKNGKIKSVEDLNQRREDFSKDPRLQEIFKITSSEIDK